MKRVLFASVFAAIALAANAQTQEVLRSHNGFDVVPKALTVSGDDILYSKSQNANGNNVDVTFNIYDDNFLQTKTFNFIGKEFPHNRVQMKALALITKKTVKSVVFDEVYREDTLTVKTMDELVDWLQQNFYFKISKDSCFYDYEGNMAFHTRDDEQSVQKNGTDVDGKPAAIIIESYYYYNKADKMIHNREVVLTAEFDVENLNWEKDDSYSSYSSSYSEGIANVYYKDYDKSQCDGNMNAEISQNLFNNDDKFEYVVRSYREIPEPSDQNTTFEFDYHMEDGKLVIYKEGYDHYYQSYFYVADEDGNKLFELPGTGGYHVYFYKLNGKMLFESQDLIDDRGNYSYGLYLFDPETTGISEVARSQSAPSDIFYNAAGIQVSKNAKGLVIQKDGRKFINR